MAAARYADDYDGFLAGAPGYSLPLAALANIWGGAALCEPWPPATRPRRRLETAFTPAERKTVANAVLARCDALDGANDSLVQDMGACQRKFDFLRDVPTCTGARDGSCLTLEQKLAIGPIFSGATTATASRFYAPFPFDSGIGGGGIPFWEFTAPLALDSGAVGTIFKVPPSTVRVDRRTGFLAHPEHRRALAELFATDETYTESAMSFMTPPDATDLTALRRRGAKVIVYHGVSDPIFSVADTERLVPRPRSLQRRPRSIRAVLPGSRHGPLLRRPGDRPGRLPDAAGRLGRARPGARGIVATARGPGNPGGVNAEMPADWAPDRTRPLCPYPLVARYNGHGNVERASNWVCRKSSGGPHHGHD